MKCSVCGHSVESDDTFDLLEHGVEEHPSLKGMTIREARDILTR